MLKYINLFSTAEIKSLNSLKGEPSPHNPEKNFDVKE